MKELADIVRQLKQSLDVNNKVDANKLVDEFLALLNEEPALQNNINVAILPNLAMTAINHRNYVVLDKLLRFGKSINAHNENHYANCIITNNDFIALQLLINALDLEKTDALKTILELAIIKQKEAPDCYRLLWSYFPLDNSPANVRLLLSLNEIDKLKALSIDSLENLVPFVPGSTTHRVSLVAEKIQHFDMLHFVLQKGANPLHGRNVCSQEWISSLGCDADCDFDCTDTHGGYFQDKFEKHLTPLEMVTLGYKTDLLLAYQFVRALAGIDPCKDFKALYSTIKRNQYISEAIEHLLFIHGPFDSSHLHTFLANFEKTMDYSLSVKEQVRSNLALIMNRYDDPRSMHYCKSDLDHAKKQFLALLLTQNYLCVPLSAIDKIKKSIVNLYDQNEFKLFVIEYFQREKSRFIEAKKISDEQLTPMSKWEYVQHQATATLFTASDAINRVRVCDYQLRELIAGYSYTAMRLLDSVSTSSTTLSDWALPEEDMDSSQNAKYC